MVASAFVLRENIFLLHTNYFIDRFDRDLVIAHLALKYRLNQFFFNNGNRAVKVFI